MHNNNLLISILIIKHMLSSRGTRCGLEYIGLLCNQIVPMYYENTNRSRVEFVTTYLIKTRTFNENNLVQNLNFERVFQQFQIGIWENIKH